MPSMLCGYSTNIRLPLAQGGHALQSAQGLPAIDEYLRVADNHARHGQTVW